MLGTDTTTMSLAPMSAALARALKLFAVLAIFLASVASHDAAMAGGAMAVMHGNAEIHHAMTHHEMDDTCDTAGCEQPDTTCCVTGHCLLAIPPTDTCDFIAETLPDPEALTPGGRVAGIVRAPFRPPAMV
jgi:hypothetical protein